MPSIAVVSSVGGCGRTTVVAMLASLFAARGVRVLAIEFDPSNQMGLHLGLDALPERGWVARYLEGGNWAGSALANSDGVDFLPFGLVAPEYLAAFETRFAQDPYWLQSLLQRLAALEDTLVLIDTPPLPSRYAQQALHACDFVLPVLQAEGRSLAHLDFLSLWLETWVPQIPRRLLVNQLDTSRELERDVYAVMQVRLAELMIPYPVHRDEALRHAFAHWLSPVAAYPQSQGVHDFEAVANWLAEALPLSSAATQDGRKPGPATVPRRADAQSTLVHNVGHA